MASFEPTIIRAIELLKSMPEGADTETARRALGLTYSHTSGALCEASNAGRLKWVHAPQGNGHNRRVYFHPDHAPAVTGEASRKPKQGPKEHQKLKSLGKPKPASPPKGDAIIPDGCHVTVCPSFQDSRFRPDGDVPSVVDSSQARPWAVAAYG